jgi:AraC-like DNA-binding protein/quercetin dioxygenase-like cupin family protein
MFGKSERRSDYQRTTRPVVAMARTLQRGEVTAQHRHRRAQLIYAANGVLTVEAQDGIWVVPPERAVWIPSGKPHGLQAASRTELHSVYVEPALAAPFPTQCAVLEVTALLRALIGEAVTISSRYAVDSHGARVMALLLECIEVKPISALNLPMPHDPRALQLATYVRNEPSVAVGLAHWQHRVAASQRTLERLFLQETGMSFGRWRQQALLLHALELLAVGTPVKNIATTLGYADVAAFSSMFHQTMGTPPSRYFKSPTLPG